MKLLRRKDYPEGKFTLAFVGYGDEVDHTVVELTHNWDTKSYDIGNGFQPLPTQARGVDGNAGIDQCALASIRLEHFAGKSPEMIDRGLRAGMAFRGAVAEPHDPFR